ncbi:uncharacterized protein LOC110990204 [Acanthaster planci]|uniref:Uncharacterized protein LOC110990204 n=1 Tax=Acanthaster planci TaxID=133434 RepID=A0A8B7ZZ17_ACAPL|nr:uncharacterized protein LOC110990204 [Acanthaster planci]
MAQLLRHVTFAFAGLAISVVVFTALKDYTGSRSLYLRPPPSIARSAAPRNRSGATVDMRRGADLTFTRGHTLTLTLRMEVKPRLVKLFFCDTLRSAALFWSRKLGPISVILNEESAADHQFAGRLRQLEGELGFQFDFLYEPLPNDPSILKSVRGQGYARQLWSSFFMDMYINASIVAWTDTDGMFTAPVTPDNIFNGQRLRVVTFTDWKEIRKYAWEITTETAMGKTLVSNFMSYFPVYIWRDTITNCRNHVLKHMQVSSFEDAFRKLVDAPVGKMGVPFSPVNVILNYAYYFEHDRYDWHLDGIRKDAPLGLAIIPSERVPEVRVTNHKASADILVQGYCIAKRYTDSLPAACERFRNVTNFQLFVFDVNTDHLHAWCSSKKGHQDCAERIEAHYQNFRKYYNAGYDLDLKRVRAIEKAARREKVSCSEVFNFDVNGT